MYILNFILTERREATNTKTQIPSKAKQKEKQKTRKEAKTESRQKYSISDTKFSLFYKKTLWATRSFESQ